MLIGKLENVELRELWPHEGLDFSKWLENHIDVLSEAMELSLTIEEREKSVGSFKVDLLAKDAAGNRVIIENQLLPTDHDHLGKLLTYMVNLEAKVAIWVVKAARPEHTKVIAWLNEITPPGIAFYIVLLKAYRIGESDAAPMFTPVVMPSEQSKEVGEEIRQLADTETHRLQFWQQLLNRARERRVTSHEGRSPTKDGWLNAGAGKSGLNYVYLLRNDRTAIDLDINVGDKVQNKRVFDDIFAHKEQIERDFGAPFTWDRASDKKASRIVYDITQVKGGLKSQESKWPLIQDAMINAMDRFTTALNPHIQALHE